MPEESDAALLMDGTKSPTPILSSSFGLATQTMPKTTSTASQRVLLGVGGSVSFQFIDSMPRGERISFVNTKSLGLFNVGRLPGKEITAGFAVMQEVDTRAETGVRLDPY